ncbi:MAG: diaminopimelate decarboxylase [Ardenticatenaceae bacterium]|nr:diaminopimelate decarboxylase [Ardenticatenaceae bacterium]
MKTFQYQNNLLHCENLALAEVAAAVGTPVYVYSQTALLARVEEFIRAATAVSPHPHVAYAVKANGNPALLRLLAQAGLGADVTSGGELFLALHAGFPPDKIIFSGVGKTRAEIEMALDAGIKALHAESEMELAAIGQIANERQQKARIGVRVNPNIDAKTHPYISTGLHAHKFGVSGEKAMAMMQQATAHRWLEPVGLAAHIGSQITDLGPFGESARFLVGMSDELAGMGIHLNYLDVGGGLGIDYSDDSIVNRQSSIVDITDWVTAVAQPITQVGYQIVMEPGRSIIGPTGLLLAKVIYTKKQGEKQFIILDAGMNDLVRPTLYQAHHPILPANEVTGSSEVPVTCDIVGPICETGDFLARERPFPPVRPGDLVAIMQAGAYGFAMASNYNGRLRPAEVLVNGKQFRIIRQRQKLGHLLDGCIEDAVWEYTP